MAHEIHELDNVMLGRRMPAWHGLGVCVEGQPNAAAALMHAKLGWIVEKEPAFYHWEAHVDAIGQDVPAGWMKAPGAFLTVRTDLDKTDPRRVLGVVGSAYDPIQNVTAFGIADALAGEGGARFETAGSLYNGKKVWMLAVLPARMTVKDDQLDQYLLISNSHDGSSALEILPTTIRVVCNNTLTAALARQKNRITIRHTSNHAEQIEQAKYVLSQADSTFAKTARLFNSMAEQKIDARFASAFLQAMFPDPADPDASNTRAAKTREHIRHLYNGYQPGADQDATKGTAYGLLNATTDYISHARTVRTTDNAPTKAEARMSSVIYGSGAQLRDRATGLLARALNLDDAAETDADSRVNRLMAAWKADPADPLTALAANAVASN